MQIVDRIEVQILLVPAEEGPPDAYVQVRLRDAEDFFSAHSFVQKSL